MIENVKEANETLVSGTGSKDCLNVGEIQKVLQNLLAEGISIRDLVTIFETLADYAPTTHDTDVLTEYVRQSLKRAISNQYFNNNETTSVDDIGSERGAGYYGFGETDRTGCLSGT